MDDAGISKLLLLEKNRQLVFYPFNVSNKKKRQTPRAEQPKMAIYGAVRARGDGREERKKEAKATANASPLRRRPWPHPPAGRAGQGNQVCNRRPQKTGAGPHAAHHPPILKSCCCCCCCCCYNHANQHAQDRWPFPARWGGASERAQRGTG